VHTSRDGINRKHGRLTNYWQASVFGAFWRFATSDFEYASDAIGTLPDQDDKLVALSLAFKIYVDNGRNHGDRDRPYQALYLNADSGGH
jgi:hypothetical protein